MMTKSAFGFLVLGFLVSAFWGCSSSPNKETSFEDREPAGVRKASTPVFRSLRWPKQGFGIGDKIYRPKIEPVKEDSKQFKSPDFYEENIAGSHDRKFDYTFASEFFEHIGGESGLKKWVKLLNGKSGKIGDRLDWSCNENVLTLLHRHPDDPDMMSSRETSYKINFSFFMRGGDWADSFGVRIEKKSGGLERTLDWRPSAQEWYNVASGLNGSVVPTLKFLGEIYISTAPDAAKTAQVKGLIERAQHETELFIRDLFYTQRLENELEFAAKELTGGSQKKRAKLVYYGGRTEVSLGNLEVDGQTVECLKITDPHHGNELRAWVPIQQDLTRPKAYLARKNGPISVVVELSPEELKIGGPNADSREGRGLFYRLISRLQEIRSGRLGSN